MEQAIELATRIGDILIKDKVLKSIEKIRLNKEPPQEVGSRAIPLEEGSEEPPRDKNSASSNQSSGG
ncbi:hypothetical protein D3C81_2253370 [compost metagenome]